jgi:hypothetical protein
MESVNKQITDFLDKCNELKNCKFIMATTKIKDLLKSIVNSSELYELFNTVTSSFDYLAAKRKYLVESSDGFSDRGYLILPDTVGERLAFIFCLLVEFDKDTINFNWFLQKYFSEDGSYYISYHAFCDMVIGSLEQMIREIFASELNEVPAPQQQDEKESNDVVGEEVNNGSKISDYLSMINLLVAQEKQFILESAIPEEDKDAGYKMLTEILNAVKECKVNIINALVCGYNYYILYNNSISESIQVLFETIQQYEEAL